MNGLLSILIPIGSVFLVFCLVYWMIFQERKKNRFSPFTEKSLRSPGYSLGVNLDESIDHMMKPILSLYLAPIFFVFMANQINASSIIVFLFFLLVAMVYFARQFLRRSAEVRKIRLGLDGEVYTGQELNYLMRDGAYVFHDIPYKYGNIDHVVVSTGGVFVIETKAVRKPAGADGKRQSKVSLIGGKLQFPEFRTDYPIKQALRHAEYMRAFLKLKTADNIPVTPVVALPGWYIEVGEKSDCLIINPKRGKALRSFVQRSVVEAPQVDIIANLIEDIARSVWSAVERFNPDAANEFTFLLDRKPEERKIE